MEEKVRERVGGKVRGVRRVRVRFVFIGLEGGRGLGEEFIVGEVSVRSSFEFEEEGNGYDYGYEYKKEL